MRSVDSRVLVVFVLIILVLSAGCITRAETTDTSTVPTNHSVTSTGDLNTVETVTETVTRTVYVENISKIESLEANLTACTERLRTLEKTLNSTRKNLDELKTRYEECLAKSGSENKQEERNYEVRVLEDREYYLTLIRAIDGAQNEIYVMMFLMKYDPGDSYDPANNLIRALVKAKKRGVKVHVLLEDRIEENRKAYDYLKENGVNVAFDSPLTTLHAKVVVIDGKTVFIGSHNWSEGALDWNHEVSLRVDSEEFAREMVEYFLEARR